jgi:hypothetical protein
MRLRPTIHSETLSGVCKCDYVDIKGRRRHELSAHRGGQEELIFWDIIKIKLSSGRRKVLLAACFVLVS